VVATKCERSTAPELAVSLSMGVDPVVGVKVVPASA
jgi:hypothetical protein